MTRPNKTEIVFVVDRSGSMADIAADMRGGFDAFIADQRKIPGECSVTLTQFDTVYEIVYQGVPLASVPPAVLEPRGGTALLDAIGRTIMDTGARLATMQEHERPSKVYFVVITDGQENSSREFTHERVKAMIKHQQEKYAWDFVFLGADANAIQVAGGLGILMAAQFVPNSVGAQAVYGSVSSSVGASRRAGGQSLNYNQSTYDAHVGSDGTGDKNGGN